MIAAGSSERFPTFVNGHTLVACRTTMCREIIARRWLPHWYLPGATQFVTYRLADTLPQDVRDELKHRHNALLKRSPAEGMSVRDHRLQVHKQLFTQYDNYLDQSRGVDWLRNPQIATVV